MPILFILMVIFNTISIKKYDLNKPPGNSDASSQTPPEEAFS